VSPCLGPIMVAQYADQHTSFEELARSTEDMNGAQLKAVCVEAGMVSPSGRCLTRTSTGMRRWVTRGMGT
jgi:ATP-dependent 26S proteasome regulatory subunit